MGQCDWSPIVVSFVLTSGALADRNINYHLEVPALIDSFEHACWAHWALMG